MTPPTKQASRHVEAVLAAMAILDCFLETPSLNTQEIMQKTGFTRNRVMRLCGTLLADDYLIHDHTQGVYGPGPRLMALGKVYERENGLVSLGRVILKELVRHTGESATLYVRQGLKRMVLAREEGTHPLRYASVEGQTMDLHTGAGGKTLLAFGPEEVRQRALGPDGTGSTASPPEGLAAELQKVREQGYATSFGERVPDSSAITAPVFGLDGRLAAAIGLVGPTSRISQFAKSQYLEHVLAAAREMSLRLGCREYPPGGPEPQSGVNLP